MNTEESDTMAEEKSRRETAEAYFSEGYNCTQAVVLTFADLIGLDEKTLLRASSSLGGGVGRLREICGAVSGMALVLGFLYGYDGPETGEVKHAHYARIQACAKKFEEREKSLVCRELLGLDTKHDTPEAAARTPEYYAVRPCKRLVGTAAEITEEFIRENPL